MASEGRGSFEAYVFLKEILKHCKNKPEIVVDRGSCTEALQRLGLEYRHETSREMPQKDSFLGLRRERRGSELVGEFHGSL